MGECCDDTLSFVFRINTLLRIVSLIYSDGKATSSHLVAGYPNTGIMMMLSKTRSIDL